ncbi:MAG: hypothetical protein WCG01_01710 [bacterium]
MPLSSPLTQDPSTWLDKILEVRYRAPRGIKYEQISYCTISGASVRTGLLIFIPSKFTINGATVKELGSFGDIWKTDTESDNKLVKVTILNEKQLHHQTALRNFGLPKNVFDIINRKFIFEDSLGITMAGTISSVNFVMENGKKYIQLSPRNNVAMSPISKQWQRISYFQITTEGEATTYYKKNSMGYGKLALI